MASKAKGLSNKIGDLWSKGKTKVKNDFIEAGKEFRYAMKKLGEYVPKSGRGLAFETESAGKIPSGGKNLLQDAYQYVKDTGDRLLGRESSKIKYSYNSLPKDPRELLNHGWKDITPEGMAKNTTSREFLDPDTGMKVRFDPGKPGANGFEGKDHYHVHNPNSTGKGDYYLDVNGKPVPKGSKASHIIP
ncbi:hypothetical protein QRE66_11055 [Bacillus cereus]|nr:hypothetical protein QRE66_11055 [Bacillus cereus]